MSDDIKVIRSFLVSLGFTVDITQQRKFSQGVEGADKKISTLSKSLVGAGVAAQVMVKQFSNEMEKLFYASRRTGASVQGIQSLESGMQRIGLQAGTAKEAIEGLAATLRTNPAMQARLDQLTGGKTKGMKADQSVVELVKSLSNMPHYVGSAIAEGFGIDEKTFLMIKQGLPEMEAAMQRRAELNKKMGFDAEQGVKQSVEYKNSLRDLGDTAEIAGQKLTVHLIPVFKTMNAVLKNLIIDFDEVAKRLHSIGSFAENVLADQNKKGSVIDTILAFFGADSPPSAKNKNALPKISASTPATPPLPTDKAQYLKFLEKRDGHKPGLLDSVWLQESGRGTAPGRLIEHDKVLGDWQLGRDTAKDHHLALNDRLDYYKSADVASQYLKELRDRYHGKTDFALAAYNSGMGNFEKRGMSIGASKLETRNYVRDVMGRVNGDMSINQTTNINVTGTGSQDTAKSVVDAQKKVNSDLARNFRSRVN